MIKNVQPRAQRRCIKKKNNGKNENVIVIYYMGGGNELYFYFPTLGRVVRSEKKGMVKH